MALASTPRVTSTPPSTHPNLERDLRAAVTGEVQFDHVARSLYATDASPYRITPIGVVFPKSREDIMNAVLVARAHQVPVLMRGGGTSLAGQTVGAAVVIDTSKHLTRILEIDVENRLARVEPGVIRDQLNNALLTHKLQFTPDVSTTDRAAIGGMVANDSAGTRSIKYGKSVDQVIAMTVLLADGTVTEFKAMSGVEHELKRRAPGLEGHIYRTVEELVRTHEQEIRDRTPKVMRRVAGYHLDEMLPEKPFNLSKLVSGSEGTLCAILDVTVALHPVPKHRVLALMHFESMDAALSATPAINKFGPSAVELVDRDMLELAKTNPALLPYIGWVAGDPAMVYSVEFDGDDMDALKETLESLKRDPEAGGRAYETVFALDPATHKDVIEFRKKGLGIYATMPGLMKPVPFIEDAAIPVEHLAAYVPQVLEVCKRFGTRAVMYGHASVGVLHIRPLLDLKTPEGVAAFAGISQAVFELVQKYGGSWSGEHGDGLIRSDKLRAAFGDTMYEAFKAVKQAFDPDNLFNPGKIIDAPPMTDHLRTDLKPIADERQTHFDFGPEGFLGAAEACTGVGACRKEGVGTMCPSYMATRDEAHSTRGRANILREAMVGGLPGGLTSQAVYEVLDLCLSCKACKAECPSRVDVAQLKAEWLQAYYDDHGTPLSARVIGGAAKLSPLAQPLAPIANALLPTAPVRYLMEKVLGVDRRRVFPSYTRERFDRAFTRHTPPALTEDAPRVALFVDTWSNFHETGPAAAAVKVLEAAGARVELVPYRCCGRPLLSKGLVREAKLQAQENIAALKPYVEQGIPILGIEPSCTTAFTDDYPALVPGVDSEALAKAVKPVETWLTKRWASGQLKPRELFQQSSEPILYHGHCQQKAVLGGSGTKEILEWASDSVKELDAGCCGMAGSFGYTHHELSMQIGEQRLFPAVRNHQGTVAACGFSCRHQVHDGTGSTPKHALEVLAEAVKG